MSHYSDHRQKTNTCSYSHLGSYSFGQPLTGAARAIAAQTKPSEVIVIPSYGMSSRNLRADTDGIIIGLKSCGGYQSINDAYGC